MKLPAGTPMKEAPGASCHYNTMLWRAVHMALVSAITVHHVKDYT